MNVPDDRALVLFEPKPNTIYNFDALQLMRLMPDESVNCIVTSPPYYSLRDYGADGQIGLEDTPEEYIASLVAVFREARRVLRKDGCFWLNLGDSYANDNKWGGATSGKHVGKLHGKSGIGRKKRKTGFKPKDRMLMPSRVAIALQDDGWWVRDEIVWHKPNTMPSSTNDRTTPAHEMVYLLTKSARYWYDAEAIKEPAVNGDPAPPRGSVAALSGGEPKLNSGRRKQDALGKRQYTGFNERYFSEPPVTSRNKRSVWMVNTSPFPAAHFATFPKALVEPMVLAGCPEKTCSKCGAPHERQMSDERSLDMNRPQARRALELFREKGLTDAHLKAIRAVGLADAGKALVTMDGAGKNDEMMQYLADEAKAALGGYYREFTFGKRSSIGWQATCACNADTRPGLVYDPFMGAGTTAVVAQKLGRRYLGSEINAEYLELARMRIAGRMDEYLARQRGEPHAAYMFEGGAA